jgi:hypothetical protein
MYKSEGFLLGSVASCLPSLPTISLSQHATTRGALLRRGLSLHLFRHFDVDLEKLGHATVQTDGLALVQIAFAVLWWDALPGAGVDEPSARPVSDGTRDDRFDSRTG